MGESGDLECLILFCVVELLFLARKKEALGGSGFVGRVRCGCFLGACGIGEGVRQVAFEGCARCGTVVLNNVSRETIDAYESVLTY